jgi:hypothetical protein
MPPLLRPLAFVAAVALGGMAAATTADAKTCKDVVTAKAISRAQVSSKESRAREAAIALWRTKARAAHGWAYRFWSRSDGRSVTCTSTDKSATCIATAKPCRLL